MTQPPARARRIVLLAVATGIALTAWWGWPRAVSAPANEAAGSTSRFCPDPPATATAAPLPATGADPTRVVVPVVPAAASPAPAGPRSAIWFVPFLARLVVIDRAGMPVPEAEVRYGPLDGASALQHPPRFAGAERVLHTDANGCALVPVESLRLCVEVQQAGAGSSGRLVLHADPDREHGSDWVVVLRPRNVVRGVVRRANGAVAAGVTVTTVSSHGPGDPCLHPEPVTTDADGRFRIETGWDAMQELRAKDGNETTNIVRVDTYRSPGAETHEVELRFPGAYQVRGLLVDPRGRPLAGMVRAIGAPSPPSTSALPWNASAWTRPDGGFAFTLPAAGTYRLVGSGGQQATTGPVPVEVSDAQPHARVELRLHGFAAIQGRVTWDDGSPIAEAVLELSPHHAEADARAGYREDLPLTSPQDFYGKGGSGRTDAEGRFRFDAHPAIPYSLRCQPDRTRFRSYVVRDGVRAGHEELLVRITRSELCSYDVELQVLDPAGAPVLGYTADFVIRHPGEDRTWSYHAALAEDPHGRVLIRDLRCDDDCSLLLKVPGRPWPTPVPIVAPQDPVLRLCVRLEPLGTLTITVRDAASQPLPYVAVSFRYLAPGITASFPAHRTDRLGQLRFENLEPGAVRVSVRHPDGRAIEQDALVRSGRTTQVEVRLQKE